jgi:hypothetical protein
MTAQPPQRKTRPSIQVPSIADGPVSPVGPGETATIRCSRYNEHARWHRLTPEGWICPKCEPTAGVVRP